MVNSTDLFDDIVGEGYSFEKGLTDETSAYMGIDPSFKHASEDKKEDSTQEHQGTVKLDQVSSSSNGETNNSDELLTPAAQAAGEEPAQEDMGFSELLGKREAIKKESTKDFAKENPTLIKKEEEKKESE